MCFSFGVTPGLVFTGQQPGSVLFVLDAFLAELAVEGFGRHAELFGDPVGVVGASALQDKIRTGYFGKGIIEGRQRRMSFYFCVPYLGIYILIYKFFYPSI